MGIRILEGRRINEDERTSAVLYSSCSGRAYPVMFADGDEAQSFLDWIGPMSVVGMRDDELFAAVRAFRHVRTGPVVGSCQCETTTENVL